MVIGKIKCSFPESNPIIKFDKGVKVISAVLVFLLGNDILNNSMLLLKVLQGCGWSDWTLRVGKEPPFRFNVFLDILDHFAIVILIAKSSGLLNDEACKVNMGQEI